MNLTDTFFAHFEPLEDPRKDNHNRLHNFHDILVIAILGTICSADGWVDIYGPGPICKDFFHHEEKGLQTYIRPLKTSNFVTLALMESALFHMPHHLFGFLLQPCTPSGLERAGLTFSAITLN